MKNIKKKNQTQNKRKVFQCYKRRLNCREKLNTSVTPDVKLVPRVKTRRRRRHVTRGSNSWLFTVRRWRAVIQSRKTWTCKLVLDQLLYDLRPEGGFYIHIYILYMYINSKQLLMYCLGSANHCDFSFDLIRTFVWIHASPNPQLTCPPAAGGATHLRADWSDLMNEADYWSAGDGGA